ncbi:AAA ATPase [Pyrobaculum calidifontis JCM 11548]|uniref:AAA ATPase n=1 Tax=Pyrobaculum calidifontis (strain DSM 21063 / JCM 11548 / VA1) TaxID=410359 RepID=A3MVQ3_PYRCJ|nr:AAA ATPase [Pyrobaculum calidifontis JCM 11548]
MRVAVVGECGFVSRQFPTVVSLEEAKVSVLLSCDVGVGAFLVAEDKGRRWLGRVAEVKMADLYAVANTPVLSPEQELAVGLRLGPKIAVLELVAECGGSACGAPATPVPVHAPVRRPKPGEVGEMLGLPRDGVELGALALPTGEEVPGEVVRLPLDALRHHLLVVGTTGSGKTVFVKELALQLAQAGHRVVALDAVGHFYHLAYNGLTVNVILPTTARLMRRGPRAVVRRAVAKAAWGRRARYKARLYKRGDVFTRAEVEVESPAGRARMRVYPWALESRDILRHLPRAVSILSQQAKMFYKRVLQEAWRKGAPRDAAGLFQFLTSPTGEAGRRPAIMYEAIGASLGLHVSTMENIVRALLSVIETGLVDVRGEARVVEPDYREALSGYAVVDISALGVGQQRLVVYRVLDAVYQLARPITAVLVDEAHLFFPQTRSEDEQAFLEALLTKLTRLGRARGVAVVFATHTPDDLNDVVLQLANTKAVLRSDTKVLEKLSVPPSERRFIALAERGVAYLWSYAYRVPVYVKVKKRAAHFG